MQAYTIHLIAHVDPIKYVLSKLVLSGQYDGIGASVVFISP